MSPVRTSRPRTGDARLRVLVIGATGVFGGRVADLLVRDGRFAVLAGSRDPGRARACATALGAVQGVVVARRCDPEVGARAFSALDVDVVVDASGPFQSYGSTQTRYATALAAIAAGSCYLDLADDPGFVTGIRSLDEAAQAAGVYVLSGASSFPVLVEAAVRRMADGFSSIEDVEAGIAPSPRAKVGPNVLRAILGYAGHLTAVFENGCMVRQPALKSTRRHAIAPAGAKPLPPTTFSLFAVPDLLTLPAIGLVTRSVWAGAGPRPAVLHAVLRLFARAVTAGIVPNLVPLAPVIEFVCAVTRRFGEDRGGMYVVASGLGRDGRRRRASFDLVAEGADGPMIPAMAVAAILRRHAAGCPPVAGARPAGGSITMEDYDALFSGRRITHGVRDLA